MDDTPVRGFVRVVVTAEAPIPSRIAEKIAARKEGKRKWKMTELESMTPASLILRFIRVWEIEQMKPTP